MKIGLLIDDSLDYPDGVQQYVLTLGKWLTRKHHQVHYLTSTTKRNDLKNLHVMAKNKRVSFNQNNLRTPGLCTKSTVEAFFHAHQLDVLHVQMPHSPLFAGRVIKYAPSTTAIVGTFHVAPFSRVETTATKALRLPYRRSLVRINTICSVSDAAKSFAASALGIQSKIIPNMVDIKAFSKVSTIRKKTNAIDVRFLGRLVPRKGCYQLLRAVNQYMANQDNPPIHVTIGGTGTELKHLKQYVAENNLSSNVSFKGFIHEKDKPRFYTEADIVVFPSIGGESFGIVLIEAMASGHPVVLAGNNPGYRKVMDDERVLFDPTDADQFSEVLARYARNKQKRSATAARQKQRAKQFDVETVGSQILAMYTSALPDTDQ